MARVVLLGSALLASAALCSGSDVYTLDSSNFDATLASGGMWLIDFYAPWCGHCKKLAPVWEEAATALNGVMKLGMVDATANRDVTDRYGVKGYPTIKFINTAISTEPEFARKYRGPRTLDGILAYAKRIAGAPVHDVKDKKSYDALMKESDHWFMMVGSDKEQLAVFNTVAEAHYDKHNFMHLTAPDAISELSSTQQLPKDAAVVSVNGAAFDVLSPFDNATLSTFVEDNAVPLFQELGSNNYHDVTHAGKRTVLGIMDPSGQREITEKYLATLKEVALEKRRQYTFGWIDGVEWAQFVSKFELAGLPATLLLEAEDQLFWYDPNMGGAEGIRDMLGRAESGQLSSKSTATFMGRVENFVTKIPDLVIKYPLVAVLILAAQAILIYWVFSAGESGPTTEEDKKED